MTTAHARESMADIPTRRRDRGGLLGLLGRALATAVVGMALFFVAVVLGVGVVGYLERMGLVGPSETTAAARPTAQIAYPVETPAESAPAPASAALSEPAPVEQTPAEDATEAPVPAGEITPAAATPGEADPDDALGPPEATAPASATPVIPAWMLAAVPVPVPTDRPMVAIVIDDLAVDQARSRRAIALPGPLTMSFLPYGDNLRRLAAAARDRGHEIMVHLPMEPLDPEADPGPDALMTNADSDEIRARLLRNLDALDGYIGVNNHMGSKFSASEPGMRPVMEEIRDRGLIYLDSLTTPQTVGADLAKAMNVPYLARDVFLDYDRKAETVKQQLEQLETIARRRGYAIGIAHPYDSTIDVIGQWLQTAGERGFAVVPVSAIARYDFALRG